MAGKHIAFLPFTPQSMARPPTFGLKEKGDGICVVLGSERDRIVIRRALEDLRHTETLYEAIEFQQ